jgi:predicted ribonuclease YlaK
MKKDIYQQCLFDSLLHNEITLIGGNAGSGKTYISFAYLFSLLEEGTIDRIVVFCNPVVAKNAAKLGFYPGTPNEKLLASQVGAILSSKMGGMDPVERLLNQEKLILVPAGDARGYEVPRNSGVYIMEAQNLDVTLLQLILQRIGKDCVTIVDGDRFTQTDMAVYEEHNGMKKMSEVFKGEDIFGQVDLKNIYRSKIANIAEKMI